MKFKSKPKSEKISKVYSKCLECGKLFRTDRKRFHECNKPITKDTLMKLGKETC